MKTANEKMTSGDAKILEKTMPTHRKKAVTQKSRVVTQKKGPPHEEDRATALSKSLVHLTVSAYSLYSLQGCWTL